MQSSIQRLVSKLAPEMSPSERVVLEAAAALVASADGSDLDAEAVRAEVAARQGQAITAAAFRQRLKRLNDSLRNNSAPFLLSSAGGRIRVQKTADWVAEQRSEEVEEQLSRHSDEGTALAAGSSIPPLARPDKAPGLLVMFSHAWLSQGKTGKQQHRIQIEFFEELERQLRHPPEGVPAIGLWRDTARLRTSDQGDPQIDAACRGAFLGLLMLSDKYPHSSACLHEAEFFLDQDGRNQPGKRCIVVPVNITRKDAPERFSAGIRIWVVDDNNRSLIAAWSRSDVQKRVDFVKKVASEIFAVALEYIAQPASVGAANDVVESFAGRWGFDHHPGTIVDPRARLARLGADITAAADAPAGAEPIGFEIVPRLADWACSATGPRLTALLGEFGMGKTVACQLLTQELLRRRRDGDPEAPLPLYFDLRNIDAPAASGGVRLEALIDDMLRRAGENPPAAGEVIAYVRDRGALVVFDGLDEVTNKLTTEQAIRLYRELLGIAPAGVWTADAARRRGRTILAAGSPSADQVPGPRILVSCRTHFFRDVAAQRGFFTDMDRAGISADDDIQTFLMLPFSHEQIEAYLKLHLSPEDTRRALELIDQTYDLRQLAERPILLRFIRETIGRLEAQKLAGREINIARLYDILVDQTFARDDPKHVLPVSEKRALLRRLAYAMHEDGLSELSHRALDDWFVRVAPELPRLAPVLAGLDSLRQSEIFLQDLRNASLLVRPGDNSFRFSHTSIREYFLADALHRAVCEGRGKTAFDIPPPSPETIGFLLARLDIADDSDRRAFREQFPPLIASGCAAAVRRLAFAVWRASKATLPRPLQMDLSGLDFFGDVLAGSESRPLPLQNSCWRGARLVQTELSNADLSGADLAGVEGRMSRWLGCRLQGACFDGADVQGSIWRNLDLPHGLLDKANLRDATAIDCRVNGLPWRPEAKIEARACWPVSGHGGSVHAVALGRAGDRDVVVAGGADGAVRLWDMVSGAELAVLGGHGHRVLAVALGRAGDRDVVVAGGSGGSVRLWDAVSGAELAVLGGHVGGVFAVALGRAGGRDVVVAGGAGGSVRLWDMASGAELAVLGGHGGEVLAVALGRAGDRDVVVAGGFDGAVRLWDMASGAELAVLGGHVGEVLAVALGRAGDQDVVVAGGFDGAVRLWDMASGAELAVLGGHVGGVFAVALGRAGDQDVVVAGGADGSVRLWDMASGAELAVLGGHGGWVNAVALGRAGGRDVVVAGGFDGSVRLWDMVSGAELAVLGGHGGWVNAVALGRAGDRDVVVAGGAGGSVRLWDMVSGAELAVLGGHGGWVNAVALGRAGDRDVVVAGGAGGSVRLWDMASGAELAVLRGHGGWVNAVALGRAGDQDVVVAGSADGAVRLWDMASGAEIAVLGGHGGEVFAVALGRAGDQDVVVAGGYDGAVRLWDAVSGAELAVLGGHGGGVFAVALGRAGDRDVVVAGGADGSVRLWDMASGAELAVLRGHGGLVRAVALGRAGDRDVVVAGGADGAVRLWDMASGAELAVLRGHGGEVSAVALGRAGDRDVILSCTTDGAVRLIDIDSATFAPARTLILGPGTKTLLDLVPDGENGYRLSRISDDAWRYWRAQGFADGRLVNIPIDDMPRAG